ncbi:M20 family metallopeptidase [Gracilibacillus sp. S3-1-1]|uniref:M20 family metallopeptidase n=1 Tax=Gracilibacillus pellucidus TaxID=3095368 RepID=A0ACC6M8Q6_9BACI|nr:M20 family metallopeptidase [Gracilibacillus sp. S3-1-1]MDX8047266.1 M20 family metallopeptidase [Gracilibacillus sp. S3-1-1]
MTTELFSKLESYYDEMISLRRYFHAHPELSFEEEETPKKIAAYHRELGLEVTERVGGRGVVSKLIGGKPGKTVALRADFDALPIQEETDLPFKSEVDGVMHACGHDAHTASLLVLAKVLTEMKEDLPGTIVFIHQHAEESPPGGAIDMINDGCLGGVDAIFGTHIWSEFPIGTIRYRKGAVMAATDRFDLEVIGKGGHGGLPHTTVDAIVTASQLVANLQQVISRKVDPLKPAVLTVGSFHSGKAFNAVSGKAEITGTVRTLDEETRDIVEHELEQMVKNTCAAAGADYRLDYQRGYPTLNNHEKETDLIVDVASEVIGEENISEMEPIMGGEDFARYLEHVPGTFFFTGAKNAELNANYPHHHPKFDIDEKSMLIAAKTMGSATLTFLNSK